MMCSSKPPVSSAVPALFTAALLALALAGNAIAADVPTMMAPVAAAPEGPAPALLPLTEARLQKIILVNQANGLDQIIAEPFAVALHLANGSEKIIGHQTLIDLGANKIIFSQLKGSADGYTVGLVASDGVYIFRLDKNLNLVASAKKMIGADVVSIPEDQARKNLAVVFDMLAHIADKLEVGSTP